MASAGSFRNAVQALKRRLPAPVRSAGRKARRAGSWVPRQLLGTVTCVVTRERVAALTFDDGPDPRSTPRLLATLEAHGARGTFFLVGRAAARHPELVRRIAAGGHAIGNHSLDHRSLPQLPARERRAQIRGWERACGQAHARLLRPPYGDQTWRSRLDPLWLGWDVVTWNIVARDWRGESAEAIAGRIVQSLRPGSIVLLHDSLFHCEDLRFAPRDATVHAVEMVLAHARDYRFVTVPELLRRGRPNRELWIQPGQPEYLAGLQQTAT